MKKFAYLLLIVLFIPLNGMQKEKSKAQQTYFQLIPKELRSMLVQLMGTLQEVTTFDELLKELQTLSKVKGVAPLARQVYNELSQIKTLESYNEAKEKAEEFSKVDYLIPLFNDPDFTQLLIHELWRKRDRPITEQGTYDQEDIAKDLGTQGAQEWLVRRPDELRFIQAAQKGNIEQVQDLLNKGINVNAQDNAAHTALMWAASNGNKALVELFIKRGIHTLNNALLVAAAQGHEEIVKMLIKAGADINAVNVGGLTPLVNAVIHNQKNIVVLLLAHEAHVNTQGILGRTALIWAAQRGNKDIVEMLLKAGADVNVKDEDDKTALMLATERNHKEVAELLRKYGAK